MAANSSNNNGSNWVTARHGGDGKGTMVKKPSVVNHHGAVNGKTPDKKTGKNMTAPHPSPTKNGSDADDAEDTLDHGSDEANEQNKDAVHPYIAAIAGHLRDSHGLTHNHSLRIAAGITKKHALGHAQVDDATKQAAAAAHAHMEGLLARGKGKK
jgi:hypothetical protein